MTSAVSPPPPLPRPRQRSHAQTDLNLHPVHVYGMTETYGPITKSYVLPAWDALPKAERYANMARQGHGFVTSLPIRVVRSDHATTTSSPSSSGQLVDVPADGKTVGEIVFSGNICAKRYLQPPSQLFDPATGVIWSGDLAVRHPDGSAQVVDRAKDIIISGGENISSVALEAQLVGHPDVLEAAVVAVPDSHWGERPKAYITLRRAAGGAAAPALTERDFIAWARDQPGIGRFMAPREAEIVPELPKTSTGKIKKNVLREWVKEGPRSGHRGT